jgi:hypothetical protein
MELELVITGPEILLPLYKCFAFRQKRSLPLDIYIFYKHLNSSFCSVELCAHVGLIPLAVFPCEVSYLCLFFLLQVSEDFTSL